MAEQWERIGYAYDWDEFNPPQVGTADHALWLVNWHMAWENPEQLHKLAALYHPKISWEIPARRILVQNDIEAVLDFYRKMMATAHAFSFEHIDRYGTAERVFDDTRLKIQILSHDGWPNCPVPEGSFVDMRLLHSFHIKDGLIVRENSYELWRLASDAA